MRKKNFNKKNKSVILNDYRKFCLQNKKKFIFFMENYQLTKSFHLIIDLVEKSNKIITDLKP